MRRFPLALLVCMLTALAPAAAARADDWVGAPITHGPDPSRIAAGPEAPGPAGGPVGAAGKQGAALTARAVARRLPTTWCGTERGSDDTADETQNGGWKEHAIYMVPADAPDRFGQFASSIQTDAFQASALLESLYGRAIRFDMGTNCGPQYLDISVVRMAQTSSQLAAAAGSANNGTFNAVTDALNRAGFATIQPTDSLAQAATRARNWVVWLDAPTPPGTCGQASIYDDPTRADSNINNDGGKVAIVFPDGQGGFCSSNAVRHEIGHNLGALQPEAPHAFDGAHCNDAVEDTMCYAGVSPQVAGGQLGLFFDYRNDDYWDPPNGPALPWWTVNLNRFLCPDAGCNVAPGAIADPPPPPAPAAPARCRIAPDSKTKSVAVVGSVCAGSKPGLKMSARRRAGGRWQLRLRASGSGNGVVAVRCRRSRRAQVRTVLSRRTTLPRTIAATVTCGASRPQARLFVGRGA